MNLTHDIAGLFLGAVPESFWFENFVERAGEILKVDRCFIYMRHPRLRLGRTPLCWRRKNTIPLVYNADWAREDPEALEQIDPLFAAALAGEPSVFVSDVETAPPEVVNKQFEIEFLGGHRALIHAHLLDGDGCWGVFQPAVFGAPREWREEEREAVALVEKALTPLVRLYVEANVSAA